MPQHLLVVDGEMLHAGRHAVLLHALHIGHDHARREIRVFAHILEVAAVQRRAVDVYPGAEQHVFTAVAGLLADGTAVERRHFGIPRGGEARQRRKGRARIVRPARLVPFVPQHFGADAVRAVGTPHFGNAQARNACRGEFRLRMQQRHFFFERHTREGIRDTLLKRLRLVEIERDIAGTLRSSAARNGCEHTQHGGELYIRFGFHKGK